MAVKKKKPAEKSEEKKADASPKDEKRKKINKWIFFGSWALWLIIMVPMYLPDKCAALFEPVLKASFKCPPISLIISLILGSLFMAFLTWIVGWIVTWLSFCHQDITWENIKKFFKE